MKLKMIRMTLMILLVLAGVNLYAQDAYLLKYNFEKGKSYFQNMKMSQNIVQSMGGQEIKILQEITSKNGLQIEETDAEGTATILLTAGDVSIRSSAMGRDTTLNYKDMRDKVRIRLASTGKSLSSEKVDSSEVAAIVNQLNMGDQKILPGKEVKVGETWQDHSVINRKNAAGASFDIEVSTDMEYTLAGTEMVNGKEMLKINYSGTVGMKGKGTNMGMEMFLEGTGKSEGFSWFDPHISLIISSEEIIEMEMNIAVSGPQNMNIPMTQSVKTVTTLEEKK